MHEAPQRAWVSAAVDGGACWWGCEEDILFRPRKDTAHTAGHPSNSLHDVNSLVMPSSAPGTWKGRYLRGEDAFRPGMYWQNVLAGTGAA